MSARVLVVDDVLPNVKLLEQKLTGEYFDVLTAQSGPEALEIVHREHPDIVLLDVMMPGMDGFEVCRRIKSQADTTHIPVVMVTALDQASDRVTGLEAGADDFLTKPLQDIALFARVRSLVRLKVMMDELRNREATEMLLGGDGAIGDMLGKPEATQILLIDDDDSQLAATGDALKELGRVQFAAGADLTPDRVREMVTDLIIVSLNMKQTDGLRICSWLRSFDETRQIPVLVIVNGADTRQIVRALEMGINDYIVRPVDGLELIARVRTQLKRKRFTDRLRENLHLSMQLATTDAVTGVYNRHYMTSHLDTLFTSSRSKDKDLSLAILDIDHFKKVNDTWGHAAGDQVLQEFARRVSLNIRGVDLLARFGGEEFVVIMPDTTAEEAARIAERVREVVAKESFAVTGHEDRIPVTVSLGIASRTDDTPTPTKLIEKADEALYQAKRTGRNQVVVAAE